MYPGLHNVLTTTIIVAIITVIVYRCGRVFVCKRSEKTRHVSCAKWETALRVAGETIKICN